MGRPDQLPFRAALEEYQLEAQALFDGLTSGDEAAEWRFKWEHPRFHGKTVDEVRSAALDLRDARLVTAQEYAFDDWSSLEKFAKAVRHDGQVARFESAVEAVVSGDVATLGSMLRESPDLVRERSTRRHHATLLHYLGANGVEGGRQRTPANAVEIAKMLLDAGAEADALADMYDNKCTTMSMLVSSVHPHKARLQGALAETLLDYGAELEGPGTSWQSALMTALVFGYPDTAEILIKRGASLTNIGAAAGLGRLDDVARMLPSADSKSRHIALALAAQHGHADVVRLLLDAGEDPSRYNPDGYHSHGTPVHHAVWTNHGDVVRLLVERGARLDIKDTVYQGTPLDWAIYGERKEIADYLRAQGAPRRN
ncbi:MAG TPA: ankyrin repeat domain-containing protein [Gemmatimonadaceae bacterium]